jgi:hypothetical protein
MAKHEHGQTWRDHAPASQRNGRLPTLTLTRPRCPHCNGIALKKYRSIHDQGDGSSMSWVRCANCEVKFKVLME